MNKASCPICKQVMTGQSPAEWPHWPFCSPRCKTVDLGRWLSESYGIAKPPESSREPDEKGEEDDGS